MRIKQEYAKKVTLRQNLSPEDLPYIALTFLLIFFLDRGWFCSLTT